MATGPATKLIEATATAVGAGMLLGGFVAGLLSLFLRLAPGERDRLAVAVSSFAGALAAGVVAMETIFR